MIPLVAVVGPTASGKTGLAVEIAKKYGGEVVSCDSMQIYKGMDIGTAKPTREEMQGIPHHLIGFVQPWESYSVVRYVREAKAVIADVHARGRLPVLAGGTGLYYSSLVDNVRFAEGGGDPALRGRLRELARREGGESLLAVLRGFDPESAGSLHPNDIGRIIRAIELYETTGVTMTQARERSRLAPPCYELCAVGLCFSDRSVLYRRIDERVEKMLANGLEEEARSLAGMERPLASTALQAIGYKEFFRYFKGEESLAEAVENIKRGTRRYAKRQMTWLRRDGRIRWIDVCAQKTAEKICRAAFDTIDKHADMCYNKTKF